MIIRLKKIPREDPVLSFGAPSVVDYVLSHIGRLAKVTSVHSGGEWSIGESPEDPLFDLEFLTGFRWSAFADEIEVVRWGGEYQQEPWRQLLLAEQAGAS